jgi:hypothetical protein
MRAATLPFQLPRHTAHAPLNTFCAFDLLLFHGLLLRLPFAVDGWRCSQYLRADWVSVGS